MENIRHWSLFQKISFGILFVAPFAFLAVFWVGRGGAQTATMDPGIVPICSYAYSSWSSCDSSGRQYRTVESSAPSGCVGTPELHRACSYQAPAPSICNYAYTSWSACASDGHQYRSISSKTPSGCVGGTQEGLTRSCAYQATITAPICVFAYSTWSDCQSNGTQIRQITGHAPSGCTGGTQESLSRSCTYTPTTTITTTSVACAYTYTAWSNCDSSGHQYRTVSSMTPSGCYGTSDTNRNCVYTSTANTNSTSINTNISTTAPIANCSYQCSVWSVCSPAGVRSQNCWPSAAGCPGETKTSTQACAPTTCKFTYSDWGSCVDGWQFRNILTAGPVNCVGGDSVLKQACSSGEEIVVSEKEIVPATMIVDPEISVNDDWKKETFKTAKCQDKTCGGNADPDRDGLANNDEFRYGTDPLIPDTDRDGKTDGEEIANGSNPLKSSAKGEKDEMIFENPKESGTVKETIYQVTNVEMTDASEGESKQMKLTGKGPANSYVTVYVYSGQPVIVTVKTDSNGDWTYTVDKELEDGDHQVYVAVTNNSGAIKAKSAPLPFVKTAEAVTVAKAAGNNPIQATPKAGINLKALLFIISLSFFGVVLAIILIGVIIRKIAKKLS